MKLTKKEKEHIINNICSFFSSLTDEQLLNFNKIAEITIDKEIVERGGLLPLWDRTEFKKNEKERKN